MVAKEETLAKVLKRSAPMPLKVVHESASHDENLKKALEFLQRYSDITPERCTKKRSNFFSVTRPV